MDDLSIVIDSQSSPSSPVTDKLASVEDDSDLPTVKISDICGKFKRPHSISSNSEEDDTPELPQSPVRRKNLAIQPIYEEVESFPNSSRFESNIGPSVAPDAALLAPSCARIVDCISLSEDSDDDTGSSQLTQLSSSQPFSSSSQPHSSSSYDISTFLTQLSTDSQKPQRSKKTKLSKKPKKFKQYVVVVVDEALTTEYLWGPLLIEHLNEAKVEHEISTNQFPCTVKWRRVQSDDEIPLEEPHCLFVWTRDKVQTCVDTGTLLPTFEDFKEKHPNYKVFLGIYGRPAKGRSQIDMELISLQMKYQISHRILNTPEDATALVLSLTKSITELPSRLAREQMDMERDWYARGDSRKCVRVDKDFNGLQQLWLQQLSQFNNSSLDTAKAIASLYPSPMALYNAYKALSTAKEKEQMLQDIVVVRNQQRGGRRLGPELSRRISLLFCQDEDVPLS